MSAFALIMEGMARTNDTEDQQLGLQRFTEAIELAPNNPMAWLFQARYHAMADNGKAAATCVEHALKLSPIGPQQYLFENIGAMAYSANEEYEKALELIESSIVRNDQHKSSLRSRSVILSMMGRQKEANASMQELLKLDPQITVQSYLKNHPATRFQSGQRWANALRKSGMPEK